MANGDSQRHRTSGAWRGVTIAGLAVLGVTLLGVVVGLILLGKRDDAVQDAITGLATIGAGLTGAFAGWFGRDRVEVLTQRRDDDTPPE